MIFSTILDEPFKCQNFNCGYAFASQADLDDHIWKKAHQTRHVCDLYAVVVGTYSALKHHMVSLHENVRIYTCSQHLHLFALRQGVLCPLSLQAA